MTAMGAAKIRARKRQNRIGWAFVAPASLCFFIFLLLPALMAIIMSFTSYNVFTPMKFVGLDNYSRAFNDTYFLKALRNIISYVVMYVPSVILLSFLCASLLNLPLRGNRIFRVLFYLPCLTSSVASSIVWKWLMNPSGGLLNKLLNIFGFSSLPWLNSSGTAMISIVIICVWSSLASNIMIYLSALKNVPTSVYESAKIDGANALQRLTRITVPLVAPTTYFLLTMALIGAFQVFDQIYVLTSGGPAHATTVPMYMIYTNAFKEFQMGYACAQAVVLFFMIMFVTVIQRSANKESLI